MMTDREKLIMTYGFLLGLRSIVDKNDIKGRIDDYIAMLGLDQLVGSAPVIKE